jgi:hypothetical protein
VQRGAVEATKSKATQVAASPLSPAFICLREDAEYHLTPEQVDRIGRIHDECRTVIAAWLLRGLNVPEASERELSARLGEPFEHVRTLVTEQAEALVRGAVLTTPQARRWRANFEPTVKIVPVERYGWSQADIELQAWEARDLRGAIKNQARSMKAPYCSPLILHLVAPNPQPWNGITPEQTDLAKRIDQLARDIMAAWFERAMNGPDTVTEQGLIDRLIHRNRMRAAVVAHVETIIMGAIMEPEQVREFQRYHWARRGIESLRDPELAGLLGLARSQREEITRLLAVGREEVSKSAQALRRETSPRELDALEAVDIDAYIAVTAEFERFLTAQVEDMKTAADNAVLQVLSPSQARKLAGLFKNAIPPSR